MARKARDTSLFIAVYRFLEALDILIEHFPRDKKHTFGQEMERLIIKDLFGHIRVANDNIELREKELDEFLSKFYTLEVMIKFCHERGCISDEKAAKLSIMQENIIKQCVAWRNKAKTMRES